MLKILERAICWHKLSCQAETWSLAHPCATEPNKMNKTTAVLDQNYCCCCTSSL